MLETAVFEIAVIVGAIFGIPLIALLAFALVLRLEGAMIACTYRHIQKRIIDLKSK